MPFSPTYSSDLILPQTMRLVRPVGIFNNLISSNYPLHQFPHSKIPRYAINCRFPLKHRQPQVSCLLCPLKRQRKPIQTTQILKINVWFGVRPKTILGNKTFGLPRKLIVGHIKKRDAHPSCSGKRPLSVA